jgi:hypothetical protein
MIKIIFLLITFLILINFIKNIETFNNDSNYQTQLIEKQPINKIKYSPSKIIDGYNKSDASLILFEIVNNKINIKEKKKYNVLPK